MTLWDSNFANGKLASEMWSSVEARLSEMVIEHLLDGKGEQRRLNSCFDSSQVV